LVRSEEEKEILDVLSRKMLFRYEYSSDALPKTAELLSRALTIQITINMDEQIPRIIGAMEKAAGVI